jgi:hypothetical protein
MPPETYPMLAETFCGGRTQCRILAWTKSAGAPTRFPVDPALLPTMAFSYIHDIAAGLRRALWNCRLHARTLPAECMREREPAMSPPVAATPGRANPVTP